MAVGIATHLELEPIPGIRLGTASAGIRQTLRDDLLLIEVAPESVCAATFTRNAFCAAPVLIARQNIAGPVRYLLINSGNANAGTGQAGLDDASRSCRFLARTVAVEENQILPFSTGVIGERLPVEKIETAIPAAIQALSTSGWDQAARAIMTTDTRAKGISRRFLIDGKEAVITGIAKGAGMIHPDMATMLAFIATDLRIGRETLNACLSAAVERSFNSISVDGDTSTNDACVLIATGAAGNSKVSAEEGPGRDLFAEILEEICQALAEMIVRDGEGATKLLRIEVGGAASEAEARKVAKTIATSPLVKTACFASDPNWGRILAAVGRAGVEQLEINRVGIWLGDLQVVAGGGLSPDYREALAREIMAREEIPIRVELARGDYRHLELSCDLS
ncbi:MAG: bifunctional glutamate N-acetyltransferase/amino-acid acetyltransferase ArgJ, partial [Gammaproteobacteria bacterium]